jgi:hypothetical protein
MHYQDIEAEDQGDQWLILFFQFDMREDKSTKVILHGYSRNSSFKR